MDEARETAGNHAEIEPKLSHGRWQMNVIGYRFHVPQSARKRLRGALNQRKGDTRNDQHAQEAKLEAGSQQLCRIDHQQRQGGNSDGVEGASLPIEKFRTEVEGEHKRSPPYRS